jgi:hypothetical protein
MGPLFGRQSRRLWVEWLEYHIHVAGFERFLMYSVDDAAHLMEVVQDYIEVGLVEFGRKHRNFSVLPPMCRKAPAAVAVQWRHQAPPRLHRGAGSRRSGAAGPYSPRTCCRRVSAAVSPGSTRQPAIPSGRLLRQRALPVGALDGKSHHRPAMEAAHIRDMCIGSTAAG